MATRFARAGRRLAVASLVLIAIAGWSPLGNALILPLEERFPPWDAARGAPNGIICLGGALDTVVSPERGEVALNEAAERMTAIAELARRYPQARIVFTGGSGRLVYGGATTEAELAARLFASFGIAKERITLEDKSRDTLENARFTKELVNPKPGERWLLVTSAHHMPRSVGLFRASRLSGRGVSGRLPHARRGRSVAPVLAVERRPAPHRHGDAGVGRACRVLGDGTNGGAVPRALVVLSAPRSDTRP